MTISRGKELRFCHGLRTSNSTFLSYSILRKLQHGRVSTPPADAPESLGLIFSQNRKSAEYLLGELAAGGLLIQLCLCKPVAEDSMRVRKEARGAASTYTLADALMSSACSREVVSEKSLLRREVMQIIWRLQRAWKQLGSLYQRICQSCPLEELPASSWPLLTLLSRSK